MKAAKDRGEASIVNNWQGAGLTRTGNSGVANKDNGKHASREMPARLALP
jgi:hypothetical protein